MCKLVSSDPPLIIEEHMLSIFKRQLLFEEEIEYDLIKNLDGSFIVENLN